MAGVSGGDRDSAPPAPLQPGRCCGIAAAGASGPARPRAGPVTAAGPCGEKGKCRQGDRACCECWGSRLVTREPSLFTPVLAPRPGLNCPSEGAIKRRGRSRRRSPSVALLPTLVSLLAPGSRWTPQLVLGNLGPWGQSSVTSDSGFQRLCRPGRSWELSARVSGGYRGCAVLSLHKAAKLKFQLTLSCMVTNPNS